MPGLLFDDVFVSDNQLPQRSGVQIGILRGAGLCLLVLQDVLEALALEVHDDCREHRDEAPVGIVGEPLIAGFFYQSLHSSVVQAEVQDSIHHARHGRPRAGSHRNQQWIGRSAESRSHGDFQLLHVLQGLIP